jgi:hypothetical protein
MKNLNQKAVLLLESLFAEPIEAVVIGQDSVCVTLCATDAVAYPDNILLDGKAYRLEVRLENESVEIEDLSA